MEFILSHLSARVHFPPSMEARGGVGRALGIIGMSCKKSSSNTTWFMFYMISLCLFGIFNVSSDLIVVPK